jgi:hypothetical protein
VPALLKFQFGQRGIPKRNTALALQQPWGVFQHNLPQLDIQSAACQLVNVDKPIRELISLTRFRR